MRNSFIHSFIQHPSHRAIGNQSFSPHMYINLIIRSPSCPTMLILVSSLSHLLCRFLQNCRRQREKREKEERFVLNTQQKKTLENHIVRSKYVRINNKQNNKQNKRHNQNAPIPPIHPQLRTTTTSTSNNPTTSNKREPPTNSSVVSSISLYEKYPFNSAPDPNTHTKHKTTPSLWRSIQQHTSCRSFRRRRRRRWWGHLILVFCTSAHLRNLQHGSNRCSISQKRVCCPIKKGKVLHLYVDNYYCRLRI